MPLQRTEYNAELYYGFHVTNWLTVRPNLQYIKSPGGWMRWTTRWSQV